MIINNNKNISWPGWETIQLIGCGSFGAVYEIQREVFGNIEKAALKVISIPQQDSDIDEMYNDGHDDESITSTFNEHLKSIVAEYSLMRRMNGSANIVNCDDIRYIQHNNGMGWDIFIKMELLTPLTKALPALPQDDTVIKIAKDMCAALMLCKQNNIIHRDIKPQNILVSNHGDYKLGDFGIAKTVEKTMGGTKIGTYKYMAPEVYNNQPYSFGADICSLGLVLYWLLNERRIPFLPLPPEKIKVGAEEVARNRRFSGELLPPPAHGSDSLKQIVLKACAYDPAERFASAEEMLNALNSLQHHEQPVPVTANIKNEISDEPEKKEKTDSHSLPIEEQAADSILNAKESADIFVSIQQRIRKTPMTIVVAALALLVCILAFSQHWNKGDAMLTTPLKEPLLSTGPYAPTQLLIPFEQETTDTQSPSQMQATPCASGHSWNAATCNTPKTCSVCKKIEGYALDHNWIAATCTMPKTCSTCGTVEGTSIGHAWIDATCSSPKTCILCYTTEGGTIEHQWRAATYLSPQICILCGETSGSAKKPEMSIVSSVISNGKQLQYKAVNAEDCKVSWSVSNSNVATISSDGVATLLDEGFTKIIATFIYDGKTICTREESREVKNIGKWSDWQKQPIAESATIKVKTREVALDEPMIYLKCINKLLSLNDPKVEYNESNKYGPYIVYKHSCTNEIHQTYSKLYFDDAPEMEIKETETEYSWCEPQLVWY